MGRIKNLIKNLKYLLNNNLEQQREDDIYYLTEKILSDVNYEYSIDLTDEKIKVLSKKDSLDLIMSSNKSFVRMNDGEIKLMKGFSQPFQKYEKDIVDKLFELLGNDDENIVVGINRDYFTSQRDLKDEYGKRYNRLYSFGFRNFLHKYCNPNKTFIDGACTFYEFGNFSEEADKFWNQWVDCFRGKKLTIVCGEGILDKLEYDVFQKADSINFIYGPKTDAWDKHNEIIDSILKESRDHTIIFILGMAGKAMIPEITGHGYVAWDIGHLAKGYNAYKTRMSATVENISSFFAPD